MVLVWGAGGCAAISGVGDYAQGDPDATTPAPADASHPVDAHAGDAHDTGAVTPDATDEAPDLADALDEPAPLDDGPADGPALGDDGGPDADAGVSPAEAGPDGAGDDAGDSGPGFDGGDAGAAGDGGATCGTCSTPGACCGDGGCQVSHKSGLSSPANYYRCSATSSSTKAAATAACTDLGGTGCASSSLCCTLPIPCFLPQQTNDAVCGSVGGTCYCWVYSGQNAGQVETVSGSNCSVTCSNSTGPSWN
jgi:hypothetical protein